MTSFGWRRRRPPRMDPKPRRMTSTSLRLEPLEDRVLASATSAPASADVRRGQQRDAVTVGSSVVLFARTAAGALYRHEDQSGWQRLGDNIVASSAVAEASGTVVVFAVTADQALFRFDQSSGWQMLGAPGTIAALSAGTDRAGLADVYVLTQGGHFTRWSGSAGWLPSPVGAPGTVLDWSALTRGQAVVVTADHSVFGYDDGLGWFRWTAAGFADGLSAVSDASGSTVVFARTLDGGVFRYDASGWAAIASAGAVMDQSAGLAASGQADVFVRTTEGGLGRVDPQGGWSVLHPPGPVAGLTAATLGRAYLVLADGSVFGYDDAFGFFRLTSPGFALP